MQTLALKRTAVAGAATRVITIVVAISDPILAATIKRHLERGLTFGAVK